MSLSQHNRFEIHPFIQSWINERFYKAVREGDLESVKFCIQNGFNLEAKNNLGETPLFDLCHSGGNLEMVKILLQNGANINAKNNAGWSPVHFAAYFGNLEIVNILLQNGANINPNLNPYGFFHLDDFGIEYSPLDCSLHGARHDIMKYLKTQWRQTLIFIGGALNIFLKISTFSQIIGGAKSILIL